MYDPRLRSGSSTATVGVQPWWWLVRKELLLCAALSAYGNNTDGAGSRTVWSPVFALEDAMDTVAWLELLPENRNIRVREDGCI